MASFGILQKINRLLDAAAGLAIGWYRYRTNGPAPERNVNAHYVLGIDAIRRRMTDAQVAPLVAGAFAPLFWSSRALSNSEAPHIWDFGGGYGEAFFRFRRYIPNLRYTISEIPEIVASARTLSELSEIAFIAAAETPSSPLSCDLFYSSGVIMNAHQHVMHAIAMTKPPVLLITSVEVTESPTYWSMVVMRKYGRRCPYITFNRSEFIQRIEQMGYRLSDSCRQGRSSSGAWLNLQEQPELHGFLFERT
jgi:putative methyltransferase (TIGR04325 family)